MNEEQVMHALGIDDAYCVERTLSEGRTGLTQRVTLDGAGPFVRKKIPAALANRRVWAALADCASPRLPHVAATYEMPDQFVVVYDYIPGATLESIVAARGRLAPNEAIQVMREVGEAVAALHACGIIHRDVSPANIIVAADGAHLIDLGIAYVLGQRQACEEAPLGTWGFAAPEQYGFAKTDERSDVYSLARLFGYLLCGIAPDNDAYETALANEQIVPAELCAIVERGSAFEPSARYQTPAELVEAAGRAVGVPAARVEAVGSAAGIPAVRVEVAGNAAGAVVSPMPQPGWTARDADVPMQGSQPPAHPQGFPAACAAGAAMPGRAGGNVGASAAKAARPGARVKARRWRWIALGAGLVLLVVVFAVAAGRQLLDGGLFSRDVAPDASRAAESQNASSPAVANDAGASGSASGKDAAASASEGSAEAGIISLVESGWSPSTSGYIQYGFALRNNSTTATVSFPEVTITGKDAAGSILFSDSQVLPIIQPGETFYFGFVAGSGKTPSTVDFVAVEPDAWSVSQATGEGAVFRVSNISEVSGPYGTTSFTGEVTFVSGTCPEGANDMAVTAILRDEAGDIVYGSTTLVNCPAVGKQAPFEIECIAMPAHATVEIYAQPW